MDQGTVIPVFLVLIASYLISLWSAANRASPTVESFLFGGNRPAYALSSGVGSVFSVSISCTALLSGGYVFGWQIIPSLAAGALVGLIFLLILLRRHSIRHPISDETAGRGRSYLSLLAQESGTKFHTIFSFFFLLLYLSMLVMEFAVARVSLAPLIDVEYPEQVVMLTLIFAICYSYVFIGGYHGVLVTDHFQLLIILTFFGVFLAGLDLPSAIASLPSASHSFLSRHHSINGLLLHLGVFCGGFTVALANIDQWYRTVGTLPFKKAQPVLVWSIILTCLGMALPVLAGSYAHRFSWIPPGVTNSVSLVLLSKIFITSNYTLKFIFLMAFTCVLLTTLDTYIITIQQVYYEMSIRVNARSYKTYILEYMFKWPQVRMVGLIVTLFAFLLSFAVADRFIYIFGVAALSGVGFVAPVLVAAAIAPEKLRQRIMNGPILISSLAMSLAIFPFILFALRSKVGSINLHLYLISLSVSASALIGYSTCILISQMRLPKGKPRAKQN